MHKYIVKINVWIGSCIHITTFIVRKINLFFLKVIEPIVPHNFDFNDKDSKYMSASNNNNNSTEYMSDMSSDSSSDSEKI